MAKIIKFLVKKTHQVIKVLTTFEIFLIRNNGLDFSKFPIEQAIQNNRNLWDNRKVLRKCHC